MQRAAAAPSDAGQGGGSAPVAFWSMDTSSRVPGLVGAQEHTAYHELQRAMQRVR